MLPQPGRYTATVTEASLYEAKSGAVMLALKFAIDVETSITTHQCMVQKDGTISTKQVDRFKEVFGWDGQDFFWFADNTANIPQADITIENEPGQDGKIYPAVKWINKVGDFGGGEMPKPADRNSIKAKYGSKLRALSGGRPAAPSMSKTPAIPPVATPGKMSSMEDCWKTLCEHAEGRNIPQDSVISAWNEIINRSGTTQDKMTPAQWGAAKELAETFFIM